MAGICGWYSRNLTAAPVDSTAVLRQMVKWTESDSSARPVNVPDGVIWGTGSGTEYVVDELHGVSLLVCGRPEVAASISRSDPGRVAAMLVAAYLRHGEDFLKDLDGPFALVLFDRNAEKLILAVDKLGIQPLCYGVGADGVICFGSRSDSVTKYPSVSSELSANSIFRYIYFHVIPSPSTIYRDVQKLQPAELAVFADGAVTSKCYWQPEAPSRSGGDSASTISRLRRETRDAVARSVGDGQVGAFLSGGLDSSTVAGIANEYVDEKLPAYTIGFEQDGFDEMAYAKAAAKHFGLDHRPYYVTPDDIATSFDSITSYFDEPFGNSSIIPAYFCASRARRDGIQCLLAGDGGDELFGGNERYAVQKLFNYYNLIPGWLRRRLIEPASRVLPTDWSTVTRKGRRYIEQASVPLPQRFETYNFVEMHGAATVFQGYFLEGVSQSCVCEDLDAAYRRGDEFDFLQQMLMYDWKLTLADNDLRKVSKMCEVSGVDVRYPLLDNRLVEYSVQVPSGLKLKGNDLRFVFKEAFGAYLPRAIIEKEKHGFGLPFGDWLKTSSSLQEVIYPLVDKVRERNIFESTFVDEMLRKHQSEHAGFFGNMIWILAVLENWLARHHD